MKPTLPAARRSLPAALGSNMRDLSIVTNRGPMNCKICEVPTKEIATKTTGRGPNGVTKCHRLECGHAWHVTTPPTGEAPDGATTTACGCGELVTVNDLLIAGRRLALAKDDVSDEAFREWSKQVLEALDGIPAESGAPSLVRSATTVAKSSMSSTSKKVTELNALLVRAIAAVS